MNSHSSSGLCLLKSTLRDMNFAKKKWEDSLAFVGALLKRYDSGQLPC
jgi:hypothetical protein